MIYLIRHGETVLNKAKIIQGWSNSDLTEKGKGQVSQVEKILFNKKIDKIFCSVLGRAIGTLSLLSLPCSNIYFSPDLKERNLGKWEGLAWKQVDKKEYQAYLKNKYFYRKHGGESYQQVEDRLRKFVANNLKKDFDKNIAIVGHQTSNSVLMAILLGLPYNRGKKVDHNEVIAIDPILRKFEIMVTRLICHQ